MQTSTDGRFALEVLKLVLHVAGGDVRRERSEAQGLLERARGWGVAEPGLRVLGEALEPGAPLPLPDMALLRAHPREVLEAVHSLAAGGARAPQEEEALLAQVDQLLRPLPQ